LANPKGVKGENFTGVIVFKDYDEENLLEAWRMENGEVTGLQIPSKNGNLKKGGRMAYWCVTVKYGYYDGPFGANPDGTTKLGGAQLRESAIMEDCNFVVTGTEQQCFDSYSSGSGTGGEANGGYFDYQVPSGGGGSGDGLGEAAYASDYNHWYVEQFILEYGQRLNLRTEEIVYFMDHPSIIESVKEFLALFGDWAFRAESFIENKLSESRGWGSMHPNERTVLRSKGWSLYHINLMAYAMSAIWAQKNTNEKFTQNQYPDVWMNGNGGPNCSFCRANAFKHALLAVYLSHVFNSSSFAKQLQDAHEEWDPTTQESQMDLDNNKEGYKVYDGNGYLHNKKLFYVYNNYQTTASIYQTLVMDKFNNGQLDYLKNLDNNVRIRKSTNQL
jgi:hypothetical protein